MKVETYLPVFPGFYGTLFEIDDQNEIILEDINEIRESNGMKPVTFDALEFDYESARIKTAKIACNFVWNDLDCLDSVTFQEVISPREYNFKNDSINCEIDVDFDAMMEYLIEHQDDFNGYLHEKYTSYDGFISFHSNNAADWTKEYIEEKLEHRIGACLDFILFDQNDRVVEWMHDYCVNGGGCSVDASNYDQLTADDIDNAAT